MNTASEDTPFGEQHRRTLCHRKLRAAEERGHRVRPGGDRPHPGGAERPLPPDRSQPGRRAGPAPAGAPSLVRGRRHGARPAVARRQGGMVPQPLRRRREHRQGPAPQADPRAGEGERDGNVNTNLMNVGGKLCAVVEAGSIPVELDYELESVRRTDFDGTLEAGFTGHPKFDPVTGEQHALAYEPFQPVRYISVDRDGRATTKARIDLPHIPLIHDMAFTQTFIVVPDFPVTFQPEHAHTEFPWLWDERRPSRIGLLPRDGDVSRIAVVRGAALLRLPLRQRLRRRRPHHHRPDEAPEDVPHRSERSQRRRADPGAVDAESPVRAIDRDRARRSRQRIPAHQRAPRRTGLSLPLHRLLGRRRRLRPGDEARPRNAGRPKFTTTVAGG